MESSARKMILILVRGVSRHCDICSVRAVSSCAQFDSGCVCVYNGRGMCTVYV